MKPYEGQIAQRKRELAQFKARPHDVSVTVAAKIINVIEADIARLETCLANYMKTKARPNEAQLSVLTS